MPSPTAEPTVAAMTPILDENLALELIVNVLLSLSALKIAGIIVR